MMTPSEREAFHREMGHKPTSRKAILEAIQATKDDMADIAEKMKAAPGILERNLYRGQFKNRQLLEKELIYRLGQKEKSKTESI
jgi:hypothetical protein